MSCNGIPLHKLTTHLPIYLNIPWAQWAPYLHLDPRKAQVSVSVREKERRHQATVLILCSHPALNPSRREETILQCMSRKLCLEQDRSTSECTGGTCPCHAGCPDSLVGGTAPPHLGWGQEAEAGEERESLETPIVAAGGRHAAGQSLQVVN